MLVVSGIDMDIVVVVDEMMGSNSFKGGGDETGDSGLKLSFSFGKSSFHLFNLAFTFLNASTGDIGKS